MHSFDKVFAPLIADEPEPRAAVVRGQHVAEKLIVAVFAFTVQRGKDGWLKYGLKVTVAFDDLDTFVSEASLSQLSLYQQVVDFQVNLCVTALSPGEAPWD